LRPRDAWEYADQLLSVILALMRDQADAQDVLGRAARHHLDSGGKAFRARLFAACAAALGVPSEACIPPAAACELLHNASLVHDDLQDGDALRRGVPTVWKRFGKEVAICLGDHFIAQAFALLVQTSNAAQASQLVELFASTTRSAVQGQLAEVWNDPRHIPTLQDYRLMAAGKSGALFALPALSACILADEDEKVVLATRTVMELHGVAYQIKDDVLDIIAGKEGRPGGSDLAAGKANAVLVLHLAASEPFLAEVFADDIHSGMQPERRQWWLRELNRSDVLALAAREHAQVLAEAEQAADRLPKSFSETLLFGLEPIVKLPASLVHGSQLQSKGVWQIAAAEGGV
jgi:geranylgeranyl pyrophosphate synthase